MGGEELSNDWFKRKYDLAEGEKANLVYADDVDQTEAWAFYTRSLQSST